MRSCALHLRGCSMTTPITYVSARMSIINDNGTTIYTANIKFNVNNTIIIIEILKTNTSTITKPQTLSQYIPLNIQ